jgi:hypothetical protein
VSEASPSGVPGMQEPTLRLSIPDEGVSDGEVVLRLPRGPPSFRANETSASAKPARRAVH